MKIIIIEDEHLMAKDLAQTLKQINPAIEIIASLTSVQEAVDFFKGTQEAELIFSDIELEDGLSFEIFNQVQINTPVIFCTAYDEYALDAFKANGVEYILKPFNTSSLKKALEKFQWLRESLHSSLSRQHEAALDALAIYNQRKDATLMVRYRNRVLPLPLSQIDIIYIENDITYVHTSKKSYAIQQTLDEMEKKAGTDFFRINRQFLINRSAIVETAYIMPRKLTVIFSFAFHREVIVSKEKTTKFLHWLTM